jgi:hypothetical protein
VRLAFLIGAFLNICVIFLRQFLVEPKRFDENKINLSILEFIKYDWRKLILAVLINGCIGGVYSFYILFMATYAPQILSLQYVVLAPISIGCYAMCALISGFLADKFGFIMQATISLMASIILCMICMYQIIMFDKTFIIMLIVPAALLPFYAVPMQIYLRNYFPVNLKFRLFSVCHSIGSILISTPTLFIANFLWSASGLKYLNFCYVAALLTILLFCIFYINFHLKTSFANINNM